MMSVQHPIRPTVNNPSRIIGAQDGASGATNSVEPSHGVGIPLGLDRVQACDLAAQAAQLAARFVVDLLELVSQVVTVEVCLLAVGSGRASNASVAGGGGPRSAKAA